jgi:ribosome-binding factor A
MNTMAIKAFYGKEARRFSVSNSTTFAHLLSEVCTRFNLEKVPTLKFKDDEEVMTAKAHFDS